MNAEAPWIVGGTRLSPKSDDSLEGA